VLKTVMILNVFLFVALSFPVRACERLRVSGAMDWRPVAYIDPETRELRGFAYDVIRLVGRELALPLEFKKNVPWKRLLLLMEFGKLDVMTGIFKTGERAGKFHFSVPFANIEHVVFVKKGREFPFDTFDDLIGRTGGNVLGGAIGGGFDEFRKKHNLIIQEVSDNRQSFKKLMADRIDYVPLNYFEGINLIEELGLTGKIVALPKPLSSSPLCIALSKETSCQSLLPDINGILQRLKADGTIDRLIAESREEKMEK